MCYCPHCGAENTNGTSQCFACQHPLTEEVTESDADLLQGRYRILAEIGSGGYGAVYKAIDTQERGRMVAVKAINLKGLKADEVIEATDGFHREMKLLAALKHPHIPRVYDHFTDAEHWYLVLQFVQGETLEQYLYNPNSIDPHTTRKLAQDEVVEFALQVCNALQYLHTYTPPIIFRDLKPSNIMRTPEGKLYLIDFGIARYYKKGKAKDTIPLGSPGYAAPEQYGKAQTTPQSDIYSLGALLHQMLSGEDPSLAAFQLAPLQLPVQEGSAELANLIETMLQLNLASRPIDIRSVMARLYTIQHKQRTPVNRPAIAQKKASNQQQIGTVSHSGTGLQQSQIARHTSSRQARKQRKIQQQLMYEATTRKAKEQAILRKEKLAKSRRRFLGVGLTVTIAGIAGFSYLQANNHSEIQLPPMSSDDSNVTYPSTTKLIASTQRSLTILKADEPQQFILATDTNPRHGDALRFTTTDQQGNILFWNNFNAPVNKISCGEPIQSISWSGTGFLSDTGFLFVACKYSAYRIPAGGTDNDNIRSRPWWEIPLQNITAPLAAVLVPPTTSDLVLLIDQDCNVIKSTTAWLSSDWQQKRIFQGHAAGSGKRIYAAIDSQQPIFAVISGPQEVTILNYNTGKVLRNMSVSMDSIVALSMYAMHIVIGSESGQLAVYDLGQGTSMVNALPEQTTINDVNCIAADQCLISTNRGIILWNLTDSPDALSLFVDTNSKDQNIHATAVNWLDPMHYTIWGTTDQNAIQIWTE